MAKKKKHNDKKYYSKAWDFACDYISKTFKTFTCEDVKDLFHESNDEPVEPRVWGTIFLRLKKESKIVFQGYQPIKSKRGHGRQISVWISIEYSKQQKLNRKANGKLQTTLEFDG